MNYVFKHIKKNKIIYVIILLFLFIKLLMLNLYDAIWWDSAVYIGMGKYIYSIGNAGLWENLRPVVWPLILGFLWKTGLNVVLLGRILEIIFGALCVLLTYIIAERLFNKKIAILSSIFLALSPTFFFFNGIMLTEIVSTFFSLAAIYFFIENKHLISGVFFGVAFLARFLQILIFVSAFLVLLFYLDKKNIKNLSKVGVGFGIILLPYLVINQILYNDILFPFAQHIIITKNSGWLNHQPLNFYFFELFKENLFYLLSVLGVLLIFKNKDSNKKIIAAAFLLAFIFFNLIRQKEMRFLIILMPYMYILISLSIVYLFNKIQNDFYKTIFIIVIFLSLSYSAHNIYLYHQKESSKINPYAELESRFSEASGSIWVSNPVIAASSDKKIARLMYYPFFSKEKEKELAEDAKKADFVFLDLCDIGCKPNDLECEKGKHNLLLDLKQKLRIIYFSDNNGCEQYIFRK